MYLLKHLKSKTNETLDRLLKVCEEALTCAGIEDVMCLYQS